MENIKKNLFYQIIYQILLILVPLVTTPFISRVLGPELIGEHTFVFSIVSYFVMFAMLGINNYGPEIISKNRDNKSKLSQLFSNLFFAHFIFSVLAIVAYFIYILASNPSNIWLYVIQSIYLFSSLVEVNWFFVGIEKIKFTAIKSSVIKILTTILIFVFVRNKDSLWVYALILAGSAIINQIVFWPNLHKYINFVKPDFKEALKLSVPLLRLFIPVIAVSLYKTMDKLMIGWLCSSDSMTQLGFYENAEKILSIPLGIISGLGVVMLPRMSYFVETKSNDQISKYINASITLIFVLLIPCSAGLISVSDLFVPLYFGESFIGSIPILQILSLTIVFVGCSNVLRTQILIPFDYHRQYTIAVIVGAVVNIICNLVLIPIYSAIGAAIGTLVAEIVVFSLQSIMVKNVAKTFNMYMKKMPFFCFAIVMCKILSMVSIPLSSSILILVIKIGLGTFIYVLCCFGYIVVLSQIKEKSLKRVFMEDL